MGRDKIEIILQANDADLQGLPMASESNVFPVIPDTDSFLLLPKNNDCVVIRDDDQEVDGPSNNNGGHVRRFSTGNVTIPYTKVKILSRYLAASSTGSCHDYCKYGVLRTQAAAADAGGEEEEEEDDDHDHDETPTLKRFNDTLGKGHHHDMFKQAAAATLMERRRRKNKNKNKNKNMAVISHVSTPAKTMASSTCFDNPKPQYSPVHDSGGRRSDVKKGTTVVGSEVGVTTKLPRKPGHQYSNAKNNNGTNNHNPSRLGSSSSTSELGATWVSTKREVSPFVKSRMAASSNLEAVGSHKPQKSRRSVSVSKVETSSSANRLPILSKIFSSSLAEVGVPSSGQYPKPQRVEAFVSPILHRRGASMSKLSLISSPSDVVEYSNIIGMEPRALQLPKCLGGAKEGRREQRSTERLEASVACPTRASNSSNTKSKGYSTEEKETSISSPAGLRRQSISKPHKNRKANSHSKEDHQTATNNNTIAKKEPPNGTDQPKNEHVGHDQIRTSVVNDDHKNIDVEAATTTNEKGSTTASPAHKLEANDNNIIVTQSNTVPSTSTRKILKRPKHHVHEEHKSLRRSKARSVISEPMYRSKDCSHSVISSTESCETDLVMEQKAMESVVASSTTNTSTRPTRRGTILKTGENNNKDEQPRKLSFRPGRVMVELKPEISSPRKLKFKRRAVPRNESKVEVTFGILRKGGGRKEGISRRVEFVEVVDAEKVVLRRQDMQGGKVSQASLNNVIEETASKLVEDRKSKVKALVGAFESLLTLKDSNPIPTIIV